MGGLRIPTRLACGWVHRGGGYVSPPDGDDMPQEFIDEWISKWSKNWTKDSLTEGRLIGLFMALYNADALTVESEFIL